MKTKSFDRREALMTAAIEEFSVKSYEDASLNRIIQNAGISKGTFYYHFQDKQALYLEIIKGIGDAKLEFLTRKLSDYVHNEELSVFETMKLHARFGVEFAKEYQQYYLLSIMFLKERGKPIHKAALELFDDKTEAFYEELLKKAFEKGEFREDLPDWFIKRILSFIIIRYDEIFEIKSTNYSFDRIVQDYDYLVDFIQNGLGKMKP